MTKCKVCRSEYVKFRMAQKCCSPECAIEYARREREKKDRKETRTKLAALKTRAQWLKEAQVEFNRYIRERDRDLPCISCGRFHTGSHDAGHYRSIGAAPHLRFNEDNCWRQCVPCNQFKSGNAIEYRINLVKRIGVERVEALESNNEARKWTIAEAKEIKVAYRNKLKQLQSATAAYTSANCGGLSTAARDIGQA